MTAAEKKVFWSLAVVCAISRFAARARTLWDWDEALFCLGMRSYDVTQHHPHPPGFPAYIALGRLVRLVVGDDFRSLQTINLIAGMLLFPAVYFFARELKLQFSTSVIAATLCAFFPNVWFYGGTAFSDVPSIVLITFAAALLLRSGAPPPSAASYFSGIFLLAITIAIRPQNALVGLFPYLYASRKRSPRDIAFGILIGTVIVVAAFGGAIAATGGYDLYRSAVRAHSEYITQVDSFRSPLRPPLWRLIATFFVRQYSSPALSIVMTLFVLTSIFKRDRKMLFNALTFGPVAIAAWLFLDRYSVVRFSIGYAPMFAVFAADGMKRVARRLDGWVAGLAVCGFVAYTFPVLTPVRRDIAPSVAAVQAAKEHFNPATDDLYIAADMRPFVDYFMPNVACIRVWDERALPLSNVGKTQHLIAEIIPTNPEGFVFRRQRTRLWNITRRHYYGAAYATMTRFADFKSGWYPGERAGDEEWRWMGQKSVAILPPSQNESLLRIDFTADQPAKIAIALNGQQLDAFDASGHVQREWHIKNPRGDANTLEITTDRDRAIKVRFLSWATY